MSESKTNIKEFTTKDIEEKTRDFFSAEDLEHKIENGNTEDLKKALCTIIENPYTFGKFVYDYINRNILSEKEKNQPQNDDDYYKILLKQFKNNGLKGKGSLKPKSTTHTSKLQAPLKRAAYKIENRDLVYLVAFGLCMKEDDFTLLMKKGFLQPAINMRDPKEAIYYWCLTNDKISRKKKLQKAYEIIAFYESMPLVLPQKRYYIEKKYTYDLFHTFREKVTTEDDLKAYLMELKQIELKQIKIQQLKSLKRKLKQLKLKQHKVKRLYLKQNHIIPNNFKQLKTKTKGSKNSIYSLTIREQYYENFSNCVREDPLQTESSSTSYDIWKNDTLYGGPLSAASIEKELITQSKQAYEAYKNSDQLLPKDTVQKLFKNISWQEGSLAARFRGTIAISRNEYILSHFMIYAPDLSEKEGLFKVRDEENPKKLRFDDFIEDLNESLEQSNQYQFYLRNPFELFMIICLAQEQPYEFMLANWFLHIKEEVISKYPRTLQTCLSYFPSADRTDVSKNGLLKVQKYLQGENKKQNFSDTFQKLRSYRNILHPNTTDIKKYESDYQWLLTIYETLEYDNRYKRLEKQLIKIVTQCRFYYLDNNIMKKGAYIKSQQSFRMKYQKLQEIQEQLSALSHSIKFKVPSQWFSLVSTSITDLLKKYEADFQKISEISTFINRK